MTQLFSPPPVFELPLSKGSDIAFALVYKPLVVDVDGDPVLDAGGQRQYAEAPYPAGSSVTVTIETAPTSTPNIVIEATISGSVATVQGDYLDADVVKAGAPWRAVLSYSSGLDIVIANGKCSRFDGG